MADKWNLDAVKVNSDNILSFQPVTVATAPTAVAGGMVFVTDGAAGSPILAYATADAGSWLRIDTGAAISAT